MKKTLICFLLTVSFSQLMSSDIQWSFPPTTLSTSNQNASDPQIAMDASGNVIAAWVENGFIKSEVKPVSGNWSAAVTISNSGASSPRIVSDSNGNATAVWIENGIVKGATKPFNGNWSSATSLSTAGAASPDLAVSSSGNVVAVWAKSNNIEASTKLFGAAWQNKVTITSSGAANPSVALGGSGSSERAVVVWNGLSSSQNVIFSSSKLISSSWSAQQIISDLSHQAKFARVAMDGNANATAVWYRYDLNSSLYYNVVVQGSSRGSSTGTWDPPSDLSSAGARNPETLVARVAYDKNGSAIAIWNNSLDDAHFNIESSIKPVRGAWTSPAELANLNLYSYSADLAVSSLGNALALFMFSNGESYMIRSSEGNISNIAENFWSVPVILTGSDKNAHPRVAATLTNNAINAAAVWINSNGTNNTIQASTGSRSTVLPPSNLSVAQTANNPGIFTEYYNTLSWQASADASLAGYLIFRNGTLIQQVDSAVLQIIDHNRTQNGAVTYGVAAINTQGLQSPIINVNFP